MSNVNSHLLPVPVSTGAVQRAPAAPSKRAGTAVAPDQGLDWGRIIASLKRFKWLILVMVLVGGAVGQVAIRFLPNQYAAQATIVIDQGDRHGGVDPMSPFRAGPAFSAEAWLSLLRSFTVLDSVVIERHMYLARSTYMDSAMVASFGLAHGASTGQYRLSVGADGRGYSLATDKGEVIERGAVGGAIGAGLGFSWAPPATSFAPGTTYVFSVRSPRATAVLLGVAIRPTIDMDGNFLKLEYTAGSPARAASVLNAVADRFVAVATELKRQNVVARAQILGDQLAAAQKNLSTAEHALEQYRVETAILPRNSSGRGGIGDNPAAPNPAVDSYLGMLSQMDETQRDRLAIQRVIAAATDSGLSITELQLLPPVKSAPELMKALDELTKKRQDLQVAQLRYTDLMPAVQRLRGDIQTLERATIPSMVQRIVDDLQAREGDLRNRVAAKKEDLRDIPPRLLEDARLERNRSLAEYLFNTLQQKYAEAKLVELSSLSDVRVLDRAVPPQDPERNTATRVLLMAILGGLGVGCAGAVFLDRLDPKFRYPEQVSKEMGLAILGAIPHVRLSARNGKRAQDSAVFLEALRGIRMNLAYAYGSAGPLVFTLSSPGGSDGKSFLAANLARVFADSGRRTLLVDADLRRGRLHHRCGLQRRPGLTDFLRGEAPVERVIQNTKFRDFDLITSGTRVHEAPELLGTPAMGHLMGELKSRYDVVICDSPPLAAGIDPFILSALTGNLMLVLRTGVSLRDVAEAKLEVLSRMPVRLLGAVLNDVPSNSAYQYYSNYLPGYDTSDEVGGAAPQTIIV